MSDEFTQNPTELAKAYETVTGPVKAYSANRAFSADWWRVAEERQALARQRAAEAEVKAREDAVKRQNEYYESIRRAEAQRNEIQVRRYLYGDWSR